MGEDSRKERRNKRLRIQISGVDLPQGPGVSFPGPSLFIGLWYTDNRTIRKLDRKELCSRGRRVRLGDGGGHFFWKGKKSYEENGIEDVGG